MGLVRPTIISYLVLDGDILEEQNCLDLVSGCHSPHQCTIWPAKMAERCVLRVSTLRKRLGCLGLGLMRPCGQVRTILAEDVMRSEVEKVVLGSRGNVGRRQGCFGQN